LKIRHRLSWAKSAGLIAFSRFDATMPEVSQKMFTTQRILVLAVSTKNAGVRLIQPALATKIVATVIATSRFDE
jgi:hypothetical protein